MTNDLPGSWPVESSQRLYDGSWILALRADRVRRPGADDEGAFERLVVEHPGAAVVLAVDDRDRVLCLRQYRHAAQRRLLELPAGVCDAANESPLSVAQRELREEAAMTAERWTPLLSTFSSPGYSAERIHYFVAEELAEVGRGDFVLEHEEAELEIMWMHWRDLLAEAVAGRLADGPMVQAVLAYGARRLTTDSEARDD